MATMAAPAGKKQDSAIMYALYIVIIIVLAVIAYSLFPKGAAPTISNNTYVLAPNQSVTFKLPGSSNTYTAFLASSSNTMSTIYVSESPVLGQQALAFTLTKDSTANVSTTGSSTANLAVSLRQTSSAGATIRLTALAASAHTSLSNGVQQIISPSFVQGITTSTSTSTTSTTTTMGSTSTSTTSTSTSSTTVTALPIEQISADANATLMGQLMNNFGALYTKDTACTPSQYNTTYEAENFDTPPPGPLTYQNLTPYTPTSVTTNATLVSGNTYLYVYSLTAQKAPTKGPAVSLTVTLGATPAVTDIVIENSGYYSGLNYTQMDELYSCQSQVFGNCGAYVTCVK